MLNAERPEVSVVVAVYNAAPFLHDSLCSIADQSFENWEAVVVDDASSDDSVRIARGFAARDPRFILVALDRNGGPAVARNTAIERARGRYIAFLDSDDQWLSRKLEKQISFMKDNSYGFTSTRYEKIDANGSRTGKVVAPPSQLSYRDMLKSNRVGCLSAMYDTAAVGKVYMPLIRKRQDYGLWLHLLRKLDYVYCLPEVLALYRVRSGSLSTRKADLVRYNWSLFRHVEGMSAAASAYYLGWNIARKVTE